VFKTGRSNDATGAADTCIIIAKGSRFLHSQTRKELSRAMQI
jgi:hypothetical protein